MILKATRMLTTPPPVEALLPLFFEYLVQYALDMYDTLAADPIVLRQSLPDLLTSFEARVGQDVDRPRATSEVPSQIPTAKRKRPASVVSNENLCACPPLLAQGY